MFVGECDDEKSAAVHLNIDTRLAQIVEVHHGSRPES
jgi:hypothetical protein